MIPHNKLVRDKMPDIMEAEGQSIVMRKLSASEYAAELHKTLLEVAAEAATSERTSDLADVLEVVYALALVEGFTEEQMYQLRETRKDEFGSYSDGTFLIESSRE
jgi:predicted house-cleaning noncanonical NTP pyrophosphatase (MazG superfamily)